MTRSLGSSYQWAKMNVTLPALFFYFLPSVHSLQSTLATEVFHPRHPRRPGLL